MKEFKINEYITLKLEGGNTNIYVTEKLFQQCNFLLMNIPVEEIAMFDEIDSIDNAAEILGWTEDGQEGVKYDIDPKTEFWGHCSNLQAWFENFYDTRILHSNLAFPLLERLTEVGDPLAKKVFKEEIAKRIESGYQPVIMYLFNQRYLKFLNMEEIKALNIDAIIEWYSRNHIENSYPEIYEYLNKMEELIIKPISGKLKQSISEKSFRFIFPFIDFKFVNIIQRDILSAIFWADETRYIERVIDLAITLRIEYLVADLISLVEKIGGDALNLITKIIKLPLDGEWEYLSEKLERLASKIYEPLKEGFFGMVDKDEDIPYEYVIIFFKILFKNLRKKELEQVLIKSNIIETILKPGFNTYPLIGKNPIEMILKIDRSILKEKIIEFFLSPNDEVICGVVKHFGFNYLLEILDVDDWRIIIENSTHNFLIVLTNAMDRYSSIRNESNTLFRSEYFKPLVLLIKDKIIESFHQNNINIVQSIIRIDLSFYFSEEELESLIRRFYKILLSIENGIKPNSITRKMKEIFKNDIGRYENMIYEFLEEEHDALSMVNIIEMLQGDGYLRYLKDSRLHEISKFNPHIKLLLEQLSHKRTDIDPKLATVLNEIEKIIKIKFRKCELDKFNRSSGYPLPLQFSVKNSKLFFLKVASGELDNELFLKVFELIEEVSSTLEILVLNNNLISILPESISEFPNLKILNLDNNRINPLEQSIGNLYSLEELLVSSNILTSLPESIGKLKLLKKMYLKDNRINSLPYSIGNLKALEVLFLDHNNIRKLPESMGNLSSLNYLSLERNPINILPDTFESLSSLEWLDISNTNIKQFPHFMSKIDTLRTITVSPSYREDMIGLRRLVNPFKKNNLTVSFGFNYDSHINITHPYSITMEDLFYGKYVNHI